MSNQYAFLMHGPPTNEGESWFVLDVQEKNGPPTEGTHLDIFPANPQGNYPKNQLWTFGAVPAVPNTPINELGLPKPFFIQSALGNLFIDAQGGTPTPLLRVSPKRSTDNLSQQWYMSAYTNAGQPLIDNDPELLQPSNFFIQSALGNLVIDVQGGNLSSEALLQVYPEKKFLTTPLWSNQLWSIGYFGSPKSFAPKVDIIYYDVSPTLLTITVQGTGFVPGCPVVMVCGWFDGSNDNPGTQAPPVYTADFAGNFVATINIRFISNLNTGTLTISLNGYSNGTSSETLTTHLDAAGQFYNTTGGTVPPQAG